MGFSLFINDGVFGLITVSRMTRWGGEGRVGQLGRGAHVEDNILDEKNSTPCLFIIDLKYMLSIEMQYSN